MRLRRPRPLVTRPRVSVVIPCYNYGRYLPAAVASAFDQADVDVDVLIVDDTSTDDSLEVAKRLACADPRVRVLEHFENRGHIQTYNDGLRQVQGDYVALLSADDLLAEDSLTRAAALMEHHPSVGMVYGYARSFSGAAPSESLARHPGRGRVRGWSVYPGRQWLGLAARRGRCFLSSPEAVVRRVALEEVGPYDARLPHSADFDLWLRIAARWDIGRVNGPVQAWYRVHDANMHLTTFAGWLTDLVERRRTFDLFFAHVVLPGGSPDVSRLRELASNSLGREAVRRSLAAARDGHGDAAASYLEFARAVSPRHGSRVAATVVARWSDHQPPRSAAASLRGAERVAHHLRWRHERRYGT